MLSAMQRTNVCAMLLATLACFSSQAAEKPDAATFLTFDASNAGTGAGQGTVPVAINSSGGTTGWYLDAQSEYHGFVGTPPGSLTTIDAPGATNQGAEHGTIAAGMNDSGVVAGLADDVTGIFDDAFVDSAGDITEFSAPGAGTGSGGCGGSEGTHAGAINDRGVITGNLCDNSQLYHGFVRSTVGHIATFEAPGSGTGALDGTWGSSINKAGTIAGYLSANRVFQGFVRSSTGSTTTFSATGAGSTPQSSAFCPFPLGSCAGTFAGSINNGGIVTGYYVDSSNVWHGFVRTEAGVITPIDAPAAGSGANQGTFGAGINSKGVIAGYYVDSGNVYHGFTRAASGKITVFNAPGAGAGAGQGTIATGINSAGDIVGYYVDPSNVYHGFLRVP
jgi:hypothetical protein